MFLCYVHYHYNDAYTTLNCCTQTHDRDALYYDFLLLLEFNNNILYTIYESDYTKVRRGERREERKEQKETTAANRRTERTDGRSSPLLLFLDPSRQHYYIFFQLLDKSRTDSRRRLLHTLTINKPLRSLENLLHSHSYLNPVRWNWKFTSKFKFIF